MRPELVVSRGLGHRRTPHRHANTAPAGLRVHHQFRHFGTLVAWRAEIEVADDRVACGGSDQQMISAVVAKLPQHLFADGCYPIDFGCRRDEFAHPLLLFGGQCGAPVRRDH